MKSRLSASIFPGLKPRPIKLVSSDSEYDGRANTAMEINERLLKNEEDQALRDVIKHELVHYELQDGGKDYYGHGKAFLKRARELGIVDSYVLGRCHSLEELERAPHRIEIVKTPLADFKKEVDLSFKRLRDALLKHYRTEPKLYSLLQTFRTSPFCSFDRDCHH